MVTFLGIFLPCLSLADGPQRRLVFISPLTAFMNLFFYIIQYPMLATVESDLDWMYRVCGHFNYQEFMSPGIKFTFPREVTNLARSVITRANSNAKFRASLDMEAHLRPPTAAGVASPQDATVSNLYDVRELPTPTTSPFD